MPTVYVKPKRFTKAQIEQAIKEVPLVLSGKKRDRFNIRPLFYGTLAHHLFTRISRNFFLKSKGYSDELGNSWKALSPKTIKKRQQPAFLRKFPLAAQNLILRISDRLYEALKPGELNGTSYTPRNSDQIFKIVKDELRIGVKPEYSDHAHAKRPLWPKNMEDWVSEGVEKGLTAVYKHLGDLA